MFEQDYLMNIIAQLLGAIRRSVERAAGQEDPDGAAAMLDAAIGEATELDGAAVLSLAPLSLAGLLQVSGIDPHLTEYLARTLQLSAQYYREAGNAALAELRAGQAQAVADTFGHDLSVATDVADDISSYLELSGGDE